MLKTWVSNPTSYHHHSVIPSIVHIPNIADSHCIRLRYVGASLKYARLLMENMEANVFVYEYTGFGYSDKPPTVNKMRCTEKHIYADIRASYNWLVENGVDPDDIVLFGRSLGSGPSCELASTSRVGGLVLISAMASVMRVAAPWMRFTIKGLDMFVS